MRLTPKVLNLYHPNGRTNYRSQGATNSPKPVRYRAVQNSDGSCDRMAACAPLDGTVKFDRNVYID
jgi:hypothetical protein